MPFEIKLEPTPVGYSAGNAKGGEYLWVCFHEFTTTDDGVYFLTRLEGYPAIILDALPAAARPRPSQIDHLLAIVRPDGTCTVYVNELTIRSLNRSARPIAAGVDVTKDDIASIERLDLGVEVPEDCGVLFLMSVGWRKGLFYDFGPLVASKEPRSYDLGGTLGQCFVLLVFQERFRVSEGDWKVLLDKGWFPFIGLGTDLIEKVLQHARAGWDIDELTDEIATRVSEQLPTFVDGWKGHSAFQEHLEILDRAAERYLAGDYVSCTGLVYPRIEGLMRTHYRLLGGQGKPTDPKLSKRSVEGQPMIGPLMPARFLQYLETVYFKNYCPDDPGPKDVSRHSVGHGEAPAASFNKKSATIGLLVARQLSFTFRPMPWSGDQPMP